MTLAHPKTVQMPKKGWKKTRELVRFSTAEKAYFNFMHLNGTCFLTGYSPFQLIHMRMVYDQSGVGSKPDGAECLPMRFELHRIQEAWGNEEFFAAAGFEFGSDNDPIEWAKRLYKAYPNVERFQSHLRDMQQIADRSFIIELLENQMSGHTAWSV